MRKQRPGTFKKGHKKLGGRKTGTKNKKPRRLAEAILGASDQVGADGKGKDGLLGYLRTLAKEDPKGFISLLRPLIPSNMKSDFENEIVYSTEQDYRQALLDRGVHPTLLPPPPRDPHEKPPTHLTPPKPPPGWEWVLRKTSESAEVNEEQVDDKNAEDEAEKIEPDDEPKGSRLNPVPHLNAEEDAISRYPWGTPWNPGPGWRWEYNPYGKCFFAHPK
jgi:hypothetical protein